MNCSQKKTKAFSCINSVKCLIFFLTCGVGVLQKLRAKVAERPTAVCKPATLCRGNTVKPRTLPSGPLPLPGAESPADG